MSFPSAKFSETADWLNDRLSYFATKNFSKADFKSQEKLLLADSRFHDAVYASRERLSILDNPHAISPDDDAVRREGISVLEKTNMPNGWLNYVCEYIVNDGEVENVEVEPRMHIEVYDYQEDELVIVMRRGLTSKEYKTAWEALKVFFKKSPTDYMTTEEDEKKKVYFAYKRGLTPSVIAKQYFAAEYKRDPIATRDRIKKIILRYNSKK